MKKNHQLTLLYKEKRKTPRFACYLPVSPQSKHKYGFHHISDISLTGVGVICSQMDLLPSIGDLIPLQFYLPGKENCVEMVGEVAYISGRIVGLKFSGVCKTTHKLFKEYYLNVNRSKVLEQTVSVHERSFPKEKANLQDSERRKAARRKLQGEFSISLIFKERKITGLLLDESAHGVSFLFQHQPGVPLSFKKGDVFQEGIIQGANKVVRTGPVKVSYIAAEQNGSHKIRVGLSVGHRGSASRCLVEKIDPCAIDTVSLDPRLMENKEELLSPFLVEYKNAQQETISGLLNTTFGQQTGKPIPVIILVPAYSQRKEAASLLTQILLHTFLQQKKEVAVLRFDFTRSLGESHMDQEGDLEGREYLTFKFSQAVQDLRATFDFARKNPHFNASEISVVSCGFSSPIVSRAILEDKNYKIRHWLNFFGITDPASWIMHQSGGIDYVRNYEAGQRWGVMPLNGSLFHLDHLCRDLIVHRFAYLEDAMREMAELTMPITWICGQQDESIDQRCVEKLMQVEAPAKRKMILTPSDLLHFQHVKATPYFYLITQEIFFQLYERKIIPTVPDPAFYKKLSQAEWSRVR